jgi:oxepin-CoA hydrolase/3-oxo-5,6-dehydrosuberyl-CoA semialdehyde dehydrogenase
MQLENYALGRWIKGEGEGLALYNSINGELVATATSKGLDFGEMMDYARKIGGPAFEN